jgi:erythromycin esterase
MGLIAAWGGPLAAAEQDHDTPPAVNLDFEGGLSPAGFPMGWMGGGKGYHLDVDTTDAHGGKACGRIQFVEGDGKGFATFTQRVAPNAYRGKRVQYTGWLKTQDVDGQAAMWMRVDGPVRTEPLAFDNMDDRPIKGTTAWKQYTITLDVPEEAIGIYFGFLLAGKGTLRGDDFKLEAIGPATSVIRPSAPAPKELTAEEKTVVDQIKAHAIPLKSVHAGSGFDDLAPLDAVIGDARIVALGEASHGTAEFFQMKHRLLEYLVEKKGFTVFAIEGNWPESQAADRYIKTGEGDAASALRAMYFWTWQTEEVRDMLEWMRRYNQAPGKHPILTFTSFDMQSTSVARQHVLDYILRLGPDRGTTVKKLYTGPDKLTGQTRGQLSAQEKKQIVEQTAEAMQWLEHHREALVKVSTPEEYRNAHQCARIVHQACQMLADEDTRDHAMAENVRWLAEEAYPGQKMVLWAHNGHVSTGSYGGSYKPMGAYLRSIYGNKMVVLGFGSDYGQIRALRLKNGQMVGGSPVPLSLPPALPASIEAMCQQTGMPQFLLPFHHIPAESALGAYLAKPHLHRIPGAAYDPENDGEQYVNVPLPGLYDGLIFISESHAAKPLVASDH